MPIGLSKTRFTTGLQCHKKLWWTVHEPDAPELVPDARTRGIFATGHRVGALAQERFPGGVLVDLPPSAGDARVAATREAMGRAPAVFEATFIVDGVFVAVDVLERTPRGWRIIEVKSTTEPKAEHIPDLAIQMHVARQAGVAVDGAQVMHVNSACRHPDLGSFFARKDVGPEVRLWEPKVAPEIAVQRKMLAGPLPVISTGPHCEKPYPCPFRGRCTADEPEHPVSELYRVTATALDGFALRGWRSILDIPDAHPLTGVMRRQHRAVKSGKLVVEPTLGTALSIFRAPFAYLDFETINPAIPVWPGTRPYENVPVQFSVHRRRSDGGLDHREFLAEGSGDPRPALAAALLEACAGAQTVFAYNAPFEKSRIESLAQALPRMAGPLMQLHGRIADLKPVVENHVYHPDFHGSFSLKTVAPALLGNSAYEGLAVADGGAAAYQLTRWLFEPPSDAGQRADVRKNLLEYCRTDTEMLALTHAELARLAGKPL